MAKTTQAQDEATKATSSGTMKFKVLCDKHTIENTTYVQGDVIDTDKDLVADWNKNGEPPMFERLSDSVEATQK